jgi:hypothetical protein
MTIKTHRPKSRKPASYRATKKPRKQAKKAAPPTIDEATAVLEKAQEAHKEAVFAQERRRDAAYKDAVKVLFAKNGRIANVIAKGLTGNWCGPDDILEGAYDRLAEEMESALDVLDRVEIVGDWQKDRMKGALSALRGIQHRLIAIPMVWTMLSDAEQGGAS